MEQDELKRKYFPRVEWTVLGPVRRRYLVRPAGASASGDALAVLASLAEREGFTGPGQRTVVGGPDQTRLAFTQRPTDGSVGMVFGTGSAAHWCDVAADAADADGWQRLLVRTEMGENLVALAHAEGILHFRRDTGMPETERGDR